MRLPGHLKVALGYGAFALLWIYLSHRMGSRLFPTPEAVIRFHIAEGLVFVLLSGLLVYSLARGEERILLRSQRFFQAITENSREVIYLLDGKGYLRYASPNVRAVLGYDPEGYLRERIYALDFVHPEDGETQEYRLRVLDTWGQVRRMRIWGRNLLKDPAVQGVVLNLRDETELEEGRARLQAVLEALPGQVYRWASSRASR